MAREYGLIGRSLAHSFSQAYFTQKFAREGIDATYSLFELPEIEALPDFLEAHPNLQGFNVTIPYKQTIIPYLDRLDDSAQWVGAVNCVKRECGWVGYNTDYLGFGDSLQEFLGGVMPDHALVLGTGGASLAVQLVLRDMKIPFSLLSRDPQKGDYTYENLPARLVRDSKLIINATPLGTYPNVDELPQLPYYLTPDHYLFDLVYNPPQTAFLKMGSEMGARTMNGERMLRLQAEEAWKIWNVIRN